MHPLEHPPAPLVRWKIGNAAAMVSPIFACSSRNPWPNRRRVVDPVTVAEEVTEGPPLCASCMEGGH